jgi:ribosomal protein L30
MILPVLRNMSSRFFSTSTTMMYTIKELSAENVKTVSNAAKKTGFYKVTLHRSPIGLPKPIHQTLGMIGLRKRSDVTYLPHHPQQAGMILRLKHLLKVENVDAMPKKAPKTPTDRGFRVLHNKLNIQ